MYNIFIMTLGHLAIKHRYRIATVLLLVTVFCWFMAWVFHVPPNLISAFSGPDENLRMLIPKYIAAHGTLPTGYDAEAIGPVGNWSYAFYPQLLGAIISAMFIKLASLFGVSGDGLIYAARLTSVLFGLVSVYCVGKIAETIAQYKRVRGVKLFGLGAMALLAVWPQFAYLSAYVNNDIIAFAGVAIITFAVLKGVLMGWSRRAAFLLGAGATVCILGYTNAYGFVLMGGIVFLISAFLLRKVQKGYRLKLLASVALLPLIIAAPFYIRNMVIYKGDATGVATFQARTAEWERANNRSVQSGYYEATHASLPHMVLKDTEGQELVAESFIGKFGYMHVGPELGQQWVFVIFLVVSCVTAAIFSARELYRLFNDKRQNYIAATVMVYFAISSLITLGLSIYYSYAIDFQPQGRYIIYLLVPMIAAWTYLLCVLQKKVKDGRVVPGIYFLYLVCVSIPAYTMYRQYILFA